MPNNRNHLKAPAREGLNRERGTKHPRHPESPSPLAGEGLGRGGAVPNNRDFAKQLRRDMTDAERLLWYHLRAHRFLGHKFRRQHPLGPYIVDFVHLKARLIIEADGSQHADQADAERDAWLARNGFRILRFWNNDILLRTADVLDAIHAALTTPTASSTDIEDHTLPIHPENPA